MEVEHKDRNKKVSQLHVALRMVGLSVEYTTADLIQTTLDKLAELKVDFSIKDSCKIEAQHEEKWEKYKKQKEAVKALDEVSKKV